MKKKTVALLLALVMVFGAAIGGTFAYLTSTKSVQNTFTVGSIDITLDEAKVDNMGNPLDAQDNKVTLDKAERVTANTYKLIPGHKYTKDPTIHVVKGSEPCYLFVKVEDGLARIEADKTIATQMTEKGWKAVEGATNIFYKEAVVDASEAAVDAIVFDNFTLAKDAAVDTYKTAQIVITACAVQADGFGTAQLAYAAATFGANNG